MMGGPLLGGVARVKFGSTINIVCDGNSLTNGTGANAGMSWPLQMAKVAPISNGASTQPDGRHATSDKGVKITNVGIAGQTTQDMIADMGDVNIAYDAARRNVLVLWEGTNTIAGNGAVTPQAAANFMTDYITAQKAANNWSFILLLTCLPRQTTVQSVTDSVNARLDAYNAILRNTYKLMGANALLDVRAAGSPFALPDYNNATFEAASTNTGLWNIYENGQHVHLNDAGYLVIAKMVAAALRRMPAR